MPAKARVHSMSTPRRTSFKAFSTPRRASYECVSHHVIPNMSGVGSLRTLLNLQTKPLCFTMYDRNTQNVCTDFRAAAPHGSIPGICVI